MERAWIAGEPVALDAAIAEAAKLVAASNQTLIAGLGTDVAGVRAAISLAQRVGGVIDHMHAESLLRVLDVVRSSGVMLTTPTETAVRADTLLLAGPIPQTEPFAQLVSGSVQRPSGGTARRIFWLCPGSNAVKTAGGRNDINVVGKSLHDLPALLAALRARIAGRPVAKTAISAKILEQLSRELKASRFGVAMWSVAAVDELAIEMLCRLVNDLNATTRFSTLPVLPEDNAPGALQVCGWMTGLPMRTGFGHCYARHDPWLFDSRRLIDGGEADCVIWISAYRTEAPPWREGPPIIALTADKAGFNVPPRVQITVGSPSVDHDAVHYLPSTGTLAAVDASQPSKLISVADAISRIGAALPNDGAPRC
jgi:formylmethanofuran dehydrogenase subunit B